MYTDSAQWHSNKQQAVNGSKQKADSKNSGYSKQFGGSARQQQGDGKQQADCKFDGKLEEPPDARNPEMRRQFVATEELFLDLGHRLPVMLSVAITDASGRTLSGQTVDSFWNSLRHVQPFSVGVNCSLGATDMRPYVEELARIARIQTLQQRAVGLVGTLIISAGIGTANFVSQAVYDSVY